MNTKILVQTLSEIPDLELLQQLLGNVKKQKDFVLPDLKKFYEMFNTLYSINYTNKQCTLILVKTIQLNILAINLLLVGQVQVFWKIIASKIVGILGQPDQQIRLHGKTIIKHFLNKTNNLNIILEAIFHYGISANKQQSILTIINSMKFFGKLLDQCSKIVLLTSKIQNIQLLKKVIEEVLRITKINHYELSKTAKQFLIRIFHMKIQKIQLVLDRLNPVYGKQLQYVWQRDQEIMLQKSSNQNCKNCELIEIKYEHLPLINDKLLGHFEPFIFKQIFHPQTPSSYKYAINQFKQTFFTKQQNLMHYINAIYKICLYIIQIGPINKNIAVGNSLQVLQILQKIYQISGISKLIHLQYSVNILLSVLDTDNVLYRKSLRSNLKKLNFLIPYITISQYNQSLNDTKQYTWIKIYQILLLIQHWIQNIPGGQPPILSKILFKILTNQLITQQNQINMKIKQKYEHLLIMILQKYGGYREDLEDVLQPDRIGEIEDYLQGRKNGNSVPRDSYGKHSEQIFMKEYKQQRDRYLKLKTQNQ